MDGFGAEVREALDRRGDHLVAEGLATKNGRRITFARDLLKTLRERELDAAAGEGLEEDHKRDQPCPVGRGGGTLIKVLASAMVELRVYLLLRSDLFLPPRERKFVGGTLNAGLTRSG